MEASKKKSVLFRYPHIRGLLYCPGRMSADSSVRRANGEHVKLCTVSHIMGVFGRIDDLGKTPA